MNLIEEWLTGRRIPVGNKEYDDMVIELAGIKSKIKSLCNRTRSSFSSMSIFSEKQEMDFYSLRETKARLKAKIRLMESKNVKKLINSFDFESEWDNNDEKFN